MKNVKISVFHVINYQKVTSAEEEFNNQVKRMTSFVDNQVFFFFFLPLGTPGIFQWALEENDHISRDGGYAWTQKY